jgi:acetyl-CoA carboxylase carboxyltransferase component
MFLKKEGQNQCMYGGIQYNSVGCERRIAGITNVISNAVAGIGHNPILSDIFCISISLYRL